MKSDLDAAHLCNEEIAASTTLKAGSGPMVPSVHIAVRSAKLRAQRQNDAARPVEMPGVPKAIHRSDAHDLKSQPCADAHMASGDLPDLFL